VSKAEILPALPGLGPEDRAELSQALWGLDRPRARPRPWSAACWRMNCAITRKMETGVFPGKWCGDGCRTLHAFPGPHPVPGGSRRQSSRFSPGPVL